MKLSLSMIVRDEEAVLGRCLASVKDCVDEIVIADTGSRDGTMDVARAYHARVERYIWRDDFAQARNFSLSLATGDYVLWLDADDVLTPENAARLTALKGELSKTRADMVMCPYALAFDEAGVPAFTCYRERIFRRDMHFLWQGRVHECIAPRGNVVKRELCVHHLGSGKQRGTRNLDIYERWAKEEALSPRDLFYYGRELYYHGKFERAEEQLLQMLAGDGWYVNKIEACRVLALCRLARGKRQEAKDALLSSLRYGEARAALLCDLAALLAEEGKLREAAFYYESALLCRDHSAEGDFECPACREEVPLFALVRIYCALGEGERALLCHKKTEERHPTHPSAVQNRALLARMGLI